MGCDIHMVAEMRGADGNWALVGEARRDEDNYLSMPEPYDGRNYDLFAILANVRNGRGFAGTKTGDGFTPISEPRGVPGDACREFKAWAELWDSDGHSHSWLTVAELDAYDWARTTKQCGVVTLDEYKRWRDAGAAGAPTAWCGMVSGGNTKIVGPDRADVLLAWPGSCGEHEYYVAIEWTRTCAECCAHFMETTMPQLRAMGRPDDVRICFFFDN